MDLVLDAIFDLIAGGGRRPKMDLLVAVVAAVFALLTAVFLHAQLLGGGIPGLIAWLAIPSAATFLVATVLGRPYAVRGALLAGAMAFFLALPLALMDLAFGLWA